VYGEDDLTRDKIRLTDTTILTLPFGNLVARGLTISKLQKAIADGLRGRFLVDPHVSVTIDEYRPFFIQGQVQKPGGYPYQPGLNVRKAVSIAGGFRERASTSKIFVVRENDRTNTPAKVDLNSPIGPGDTVTVEESFF
jgi:polysaccharide export outer membrane protein